MAFFKCSLCVCCLLCAGMAGVKAKDVAKEAVPNGVQPFSIVAATNPIGKVIEMIQEITDEVRKEAVDEKTIFANFACFCKDKTGRLEKMVNHHASKISKSSASIADWTAQTNEMHSDIKKRMLNHEEFSSQFADYKHRLATENTNWENIVANYNNNKVLIDQALNALTSLREAKKQISGLQVSSESLLQIPGSDKIRKVLDMADALGLVTAPKQKALATSLLQGGKHANPLEGYEFHEGSDDIIDLIGSMKGELKTLQKSEQEEHTRAEASYKDMITVLRHKIDENQQTIKDVKHSDSTMRTEIAQMRQVLIEEKHDLEDSDGVLKQVTSACQSRAEEYDARFAMRTKELAALTTAMACLTNSHLIAKSQASNTATNSLENKALDLLQSAPASKTNVLPQPDHTPSKSLRIPKHVDIAEVKAKAVEKVGSEVKAAVPVKAAKKSLSFLQERSVKSHEGRAELSSKEKQERQKQALGVIMLEGQRSKSLMLTSLAASLGDDPFAKVIRLISDLRWRLEEEEHAEVDKVVWCSESLEKAKHERNTRFEETKFLSMQVQRLEAKMDELKAEIAYQSRKAKEIGESLVKIYTDVAQLSAQQLEAMTAQKEAREEMQTAITTLRSFYSMAAKASARHDNLLQIGKNDTKIREDFRNERRDIHVENKQRRDADGKRSSERNERARQRIGDLEGDVPAMGRQGSLGDALALMETIVSDFDREIGNLQGDLDAEHQELVKTNQILLSQKEKAEELRDLDMRDLKSTKVTKSIKFGDMQTSMNLLDLALKELEGLKPTCIDTGMSYKERVEAREVEMTALNKALCILGETDEKFGCSD